MDHSLPGSSVYGILQARFLEWVAMPSSRGSPALVGGFFTASATWESSLAIDLKIRRVAWIIQGFQPNYMSLEPIIQSEVSQKDKHQYSITNTYIWNLERW